MGSVNVDAVEEYREVSERYEFMSAQMADVQNSKRELERIISELTEEMCRIFSYKNLVVVGAFTHLCSDETRTEPDIAYTTAQATAFNQVVSDLKQRGYSCGKVHLLASYGLINYPELAGVSVLLYTAF